MMGQLQYRNDIVSIPDIIKRGKTLLKDDDYSGRVKKGSDVINSISPRSPASSRTISLPAGTAKKLEALKKLIFVTNAAN
jgi:hypothetical protein